MKEIGIPLNFTTTPVLYDSKQSFSASDESSGVLTFTTTANVTGTVANLTLRNASDNANRQTILVERLDINSSPFSYTIVKPLPFGNYEGEITLKKGTQIIASAMFLFGVNSSLSASVLPKLLEAYSLDNLVEEVETEVSNLKDAYNLTVSETVKGVKKTESTLQLSENVRYLNEATRKANELLRISQEASRKANELLRISQEASRVVAEGERVTEFGNLVDSAVIEQVVTQEVAEKFAEIDAIQSDRLFSVESELAENEGGLASVQNANAKDFLRIENYLGNFENIHPKVINFETAWNGFKYWMAYTPYPGGDTTAENPCIAVSNDLINWTVPAGLVNPLAPYPGDGYNNDTHLLYRSDTNTIEIWWRYYRVSDGKQLFYRRTSTNGVAWTSKELVITSDLISMVSQCVIFEGGKYKLWAAQGGGIIYMESAGSSVSTWTQPTTLNIDWGELIPWHMDIIRTDTGLEMVVQAYGSGGTTNSADLYYVQSDGNAFTKPKLILARNVDPQAFDSVGIYRSSLIKEKDVYHLFYSAVGPAARRAMALSSGRNIFGLNGVSSRNERMLTVSDDSKTELSLQEIRDYDKFRFMGGGVTELSMLKGGYVGQRITLAIGKSSSTLKVVLKYNPPYLEMPNGKDFILETSGGFRVTMAVDLICQQANFWRVVGHVPLDVSVSGKSFYAVSAGGTVDELDVSNIDVVTLGGAGIEVKSLKRGYKGKVVHFVTTSGATNATIVNSTRLIAPGNTNYVFTPAKMGMTAICMSPEPYNVWRVF